MVCCGEKFTKFNNEIISDLLTSCSILFYTEQIINPRLNLPQKCLKHINILSLVLKKHY